jgi:hypothetical protein
MRVGTGSTSAGSACHGTIGQRVRDERPPFDNSRHRLDFSGSGSLGLSGSRNGREESPQLNGIQATITSDTRAYIHAERSHRLDRLRNVLRC